MRVVATPRVDRAHVLAAGLTDAGVPATVDPAALAGLLYGDDSAGAVVLVPPPSLDYTGGTYAGPLTSWRLVLVASPGLGVLRAWESLDTLLDDLAGLLAVETAEPTSYALPDAAEPAPAYAVTITETLGSE